LTLLLDTRLPEDLPLFDFGKNVESKKKKEKKNIQEFFFSNSDICRNGERVRGV
jgi:hypothetical protein